MIYVPNLEDYSCVVVRDSNTIRAYKSMPQQNTSVYYTDYYVNSNYLFTENYQNFGYNSSLPNCIDSSKLTDNVYYRNDIDSILIVFIILVFVCIIFPLKIFGRMFRRFLWKN